MVTCSMDTSIVKLYGTMDARHTHPIYFSELATCCMLCLSWHCPFHATNANLTKPNRKRFM